MAPPVNDNLADAVLLPLDGTIVSGTLVDATLETDEFVAVTEDASVWYKCVAERTGNFQVTVTCTTEKMVGIYSYNHRDQILIENAPSTYDFATGSHDIALFMNRGYHLWVKVAAEAANHEAFTIQFTGDITAGTIPANRYFAGAIPITDDVGTVTTIESFSGQNDWDVPDPWFRSPVTNWYAFTAPQDGVVVFQTYLDPDFTFEDDTLMLAARMPSGGLGVGDLEILAFSDSRDYTTDGDMAGFAVRVLTGDVVYIWVSPYQSNNPSGLPIRIDWYMGAFLANDEPSAPQVVSGNSGSVSGIDTTFATYNYLLEPGAGGDTFADFYAYTDGTLWYEWTAPSDWPVDQLMSFSLAGTIDSTGDNGFFIDVFQGTDYADLVEFYDDNYWNTPPYQTSWSPVAGETYLIRIGSNAGPWTDIEWTWFPLVPPGNDSFSTPDVVGLFPVTGNAQLSTVVSGEVFSDSDKNFGSVWFSYTPVADERMTLKVDNNQLALSCWTGGTDATDQTEVGVVSYNRSPQYRLVELTGGETYYFRVSTQFPDNNNQSFTLAQVAPPTNDNLIDALVLFGQTIGASGDTTAATRESLEPAVSTPIKETIWYKWQSNRTQTLRFEVSHFFVDGFTDKALFIYTGDQSDVSSMTLVPGQTQDHYSGDSSTMGVDGVQWDAVAGVTYYLQVISEDGRGGPFSLILALPHITVRHYIGSENTSIDDPPVLGHFQVSYSTDPDPIPDKTLYASITGVEPVLSNDDDSDYLQADNPGLNAAWHAAGNSSDVFFIMRAVLDEPVTELNGGGRVVDNIRFHFWLDSDDNSQVNIQVQGQQGTPAQGSSFISLNVHATLAGGDYSHYVAPIPSFALSAMRLRLQQGFVEAVVVCPKVPGPESKVRWSRCYVEVEYHDTIKNGAWKLYDYVNAEWNKLGQPAAYAPVDDHPLKLWDYVNSLWWKEYDPSQGVGPGPSGGFMSEWIQPPNQTQTDNTFGGTGGRTRQVEAGFSQSFGGPNPANDPLAVACVFGHATKGWGFNHPYWSPSNNVEWLGGPGTCPVFPGGEFDISPSLVTGAYSCGLFYSADSGAPFLPAFMQIQSYWAEWRFEAYQFSIDHYHPSGVPTPGGSNGLNEWEDANAEILAIKLLIGGPHGYGGNLPSIAAGETVEFWFVPFTASLPDLGSWSNSAGDNLFNGSDTARLPSGATLITTLSPGDNTVHEWDVPAEYCVIPPDEPGSGPNDYGFAVLALTTLQRTGAVPGSFAGVTSVNLTANFLSCRAQVTIRPTRVRYEFVPKAFKGYDYVNEEWTTICYMIPNSV